MKNKLKRHIGDSANKRTTIRTSILELIRVMNELTSDDNLVVAAARHLLTLCRVTTARSLTPIKITARSKAHTFASSRESVTLASAAPAVRSEPSASGFGAREMMRSA
jgi:hypothetical protein